MLSMTTILSALGAAVVALIAAFAGGRVTGKTAAKREEEQRRGKALRRQREIERGVRDAPIRDVHDELEGWGP